MKRIVIALLAASALGAAAPAFAHDGDRPDGYTDWDDGGGYGRLAEMVQHDYEGVQHGVSDGAYTRWEAAGFSRELADIRRQADYFRDRDGLRPWERQIIERRLDSLHQRMHIAHDDGHEPQTFGYR